VDLPGVASNDGNIGSVAADKDMRRARAPQPPDKSDLILHLWAERVEQHGPQARKFRLRAQGFCNIPAIDRAIVDDGEMRSAPLVDKDTRDRLRFVISARCDAPDRPAGTFLAIG